MKVKVEIGKHETQEEAEEQLYKALRSKRKQLEELDERYADPALNEFHDQILEDHLNILEQIKDQISVAIKRLVQSRG